MLRVLFTVTLVSTGLDNDLSPSNADSVPKSRRIIPYSCHSYPHIEILYFHHKTTISYQWPLLLTWFNFNPSMDK